MVRATLAVAVAVAVGLGAAGCGDNDPGPLAWGLGVQTFDAYGLGLGTAASAEPWVAAIRPSPRLTVPTYDGSNQVVHPDVLVETTPDGTRALLAITPYPFSNGRFENPSLFTSADGAQFEPLAGAPSPLVPAPAFDHNDDPDLRRDPTTGAYELLYLETLRPDLQNLVALRSNDLIHWTRHDAVVYDLVHGAPFIVSPAAIVDDDGRTRMFFVDLTAGSTIASMLSDDGVTWNLAAAVPTAIDLGGVTAWHVDVIRGGNGYGMLISGYDAEFTQQNLYLATSHDLISWTFQPTPLLDYTDPALDVSTLYRSTGVVSGDTLVVWYSMQYQP